MAKEFLILSREQLPDGGERYHYLAFLPINPPIVAGAANAQPTGIVVKPTESNTLPPEVDLYGLLTTQEKDLLDAGAFMFVRDDVDRLPGETALTTVEKMKKRYAAKAASVVANLRKQYAHTGLRIDF